MWLLAEQMPNMRIYIAAQTADFGRCFGACHARRTALETAGFQLCGPASKGNRHEPTAEVPEFAQARSGYRGLDA